MIPYILLPRFFKLIGLLIALTGYVWAFNYNHSLDNLKHGAGLWIQVLVLTGLLFIVGSREKVEDEMIKQMRLTSLQWAVFILIALRLIYKSIAFYTEDENWLPHWNMNALLLFYLLLFYYQFYIKDWFLVLFKGDKDAK